LPPEVPEDAVERERPTMAVADWDDVEAAAWGAGPRVEMTFVHAERPDPWTQVVEMVSARDEVGYLIARRDPPPEGTPPGSDLDRGESIPIRLEFRLGRFGDPATEWAFLTDVVDRLEQLRGVYSTPIRWRER
jgi:hypothetical protein